MTDLHKAFEAWCEETGAHPWGAMAFGRAMTEKGYERRKASARYWAGLAWSADPFAATVLSRAGLAPPPATPPEASPEDFVRSIKDADGVSEVVLVVSKNDVDY